MRKKLIILFSILAFFSASVLLGSAVFSVRHVNAILSDGKDAKILTEAAADIKGKSIFLLNEEKIIEKINRENPKYFVKDIVKKFPDKVLIYAKERVAGGYIKIDKQYYIIDSTLTVMDIQEREPTLVPNIVIEQLPQAAEKGHALIANNELETARQIINALELLGQKYIYQSKKVICDCSSGNIYILTRSGVVIHIVRLNNLYSKVQAAYSLYEHSPHYRLSGTITAYEDKDDNLLVSYRPQAL